MYPGDLIGSDNRGTKCVRLVQKFLREPVSYSVKRFFYSIEKDTELYINTYWLLIAKTLIVIFLTRCPNTFLFQCMGV